MVLTSKNIGKVFSKEYYKILERGLEDRNSITAAEREFVGLEDNQGLGREDPDTFKISTAPVDTETAAKSKKIDQSDGPITIGGEC